MITSLLKETSNYACETQERFGTLLLGCHISLYSHAFSYSSRISAFLLICSFTILNSNVCRVVKILCYLALSCEYLKHQKKKNRRRIFNLEVETSGDIKRNSTWVKHTHACIYLHTCTHICPYT